MNEPEEIIESQENKEEVTIELPEIEINELKTYKNKYLSLLADAENSRRRLQKEKSEIIQWSLHNLLLDFLNPIDHMENALNYTEQSTPEVQQWATGFQMILTQFKDILMQQGIRPIETKDRPFDPHLHEAIEMIVTKEVAPNTIVEETLKGYMIGERTLRPAKVKVAKAPEEENQNNNEK